jgi:hypothetical protein
MVLPDAYMPGVALRTYDYSGSPEVYSASLFGGLRFALHNLAAHSISGHLPLLMYLQQTAANVDLKIVTVCNCMRHCNKRCVVLQDSDCSMLDDIRIDR